MIECKSARELEIMRRAGVLVAEVHRLLAGAVKPGVTTGELNFLADHAIRDVGAIPAFKGYHGFPGSICASINDEVVHGIPGARKLQQGDIISIDVGVIVDGYYGDAAVTYPVGEISEQARRLLEVTSGSLTAGIAAAKAGARLSDISYSVQQFVEASGMSVVRDYVGHGIGRQMHEQPQIPNFGAPGQGPVLRHGMTLAIEPMVNIGTYDVFTEGDKWTVRTKDGSLSAHFEHTIAIEDDTPAVLTRPENESGE
ncbi:MAG: type I methionyl aminopeptidase [Thermaerobacterales bacterium]